MTVAIALHNKSGIYVASDGRISSETTIVSENCRKWIKFTSNESKDWYIGTAGFFRTEILLKKNLTRIIGTKKLPRDPFVLASAIRTILAADEYFANRDETGPVLSEDEFLLAQNDRLFSLDSSFTPHKVSGYGFRAIGSGSSLAKGCLFGVNASTLRTQTASISALKKSVQAAAAFNLGCGGTFYCEKIG